MKRTRHLASGLVVSVALGGARPASAPCEVTELRPPTGSMNSVAMDADVIVIGHQYAYGVSYFTGAAFVYRYEGGLWEHEATLYAPDGEFDDRFGSSVAISGDVVVVGSMDDEHDGFDVGSSYVYRFDGTGWVEEAKLIPPDGEFTDRFGQSVAISGGTLIVGAYLDDDAGDRSGSAYVYRHNGSDWRLETKLVAADGGEGDEFGISVEIEDDVSVIGARHFFNGGAGAAYVFRFNGTMWIEEAKLEASDGEENDFFGADVDISEDKVIVGALGNDDFGSFTGSAYVFSFEGTTWSMEQKLYAIPPALGDRFGETVSVSGDLVIVGAHGDNPTGSVTVYQSVNGTWSWTERIDASDGSVGDGFGRYGIAVQRDIAVVLAYNHQHGAHTGSAYIFAGLKLIDCDDDGIADSCQIAEGSSEDCNSNFVPDACDIADGTSEDVGANGIPDECECPWDLNGDDFVGIADLLDLVFSFGPCIGCPADFDGDGVVGILDLLALLQNFGPCPGSVACPWDVNGDEVVDQSDLWRVFSNLGPCDGCPEDVNGDSVVDLLDVIEVATHFGPCP